MPNDDTWPEPLQDGEGCPRLEEDVEAKCAYVRLSKEAYAWTIFLSDWVNVDLDADGRAIGVEILALPSERHPR